MHQNKPILQRYSYYNKSLHMQTSYIIISRREALRKWKDKRGLVATYGNLMKVCIEAGHSQCAEAMCEILKKKCEDHYFYFEARALCANNDKAL